MRVVLVLRTVDVILLAALFVVGLTEMWLVHRLGHKLAPWFRLLGYTAGWVALILAGLTFYHSM